MSELREIDTRKSIKVVTSNSFITAKGLDKLSLKAKKLLYVAAAQCKKNDEEFYEYKIKVSDFAEMMQIDKSHVYAEAFNITKELATCNLSYIPEGTKNFKHIPVTSICEYDDENYLRIELNKRMTEFLLKLKGDFSQPLLDDFMKMRSPYSMAIWHLMQREMKSKKPSTKRMEFYISLDELRAVTGTENQKTYDILNNFKQRILNKALREIKDNCATEITYTNKKEGRTVVGFNFVALNLYGIDLTDWEEENPVEAEWIRKKARKVNLQRLSKERPLTIEEDNELQSLILEIDQMTLF